MITGGSGLFGSNAARSTAQDFEVFATYNSNASQIPECKSVPLDIRDKRLVVSTFEEIRPVLVIHAAALVDVDYCEDHAEEAYATNVQGTENVVLASRRVQAKVIYISTDSVFDGKRGMYAEEDIPHPLSVYATTKLEGEERARDCLRDSIVVRTAFFGWSRRTGNKLSLAEWVVNGLRQGKTLDMFPDVFFSPVFVGNLVEAIVEMYRKGLSGTYHIGGSERCSKYAFGLRLAEAFGLNKRHIRPRSVTEAGLRAPRPRDLSLDIGRISRLITTRLLNVEEGVSRLKDSAPFADGVLR